MCLGRIVLVQGDIIACVDSWAGASVIYVALLLFSDAFCARICEVQLSCSLHAAQPSVCVLQMIAMHATTCRMVVTLGDFRQISTSCVNSFKDAGFSKQQRFAEMPTSWGGAAVCVYRRRQQA